MSDRLHKACRLALIISMLSWCGAASGLGMYVGWRYVEKARNSATATELAKRDRARDDLVRALRVSEDARRALAAAVLRHLEDENAYLAMSTKSTLEAAQSSRDAMHSAAMLAWVQDGGQR